MNDLVSIIVPVYNVEKYIHKCVDSIINQDYKNIEIILIDDGSPDNCPKICDEYAKLDERIKVIHKKNGGLSSARNAGIDIATGDYIVFVDSDDYVEPFYISNLIDIKRKHNVSFSCSSYDMIYDNDVVNCNYNDDVIIKKEDLLPSLLRGKYGVGVGVDSKLFPTTIFDNTRFPNEKLCEDLLISDKLYNNFDSTIISNKVAYHYRQSSNSILHSSLSYESYCYVTSYLLNKIDSCNDKSLLSAYVFRLFSVNFSYSLFIAKIDNKHYIDSYCKNSKLYLKYYLRDNEITFLNKLKAILISNKYFFLLFCYIKTNFYYKIRKAQ